MPTRIVVPELGESVLEATVSRWLKKQGDRVAMGEPVVTLETEKVDLEVGAERSGVLARIERQEGEDVKIGETLGLIEEGAVQPSPGRDGDHTATLETPAQAAPTLVPAESPTVEPHAPEPDRAATPSARRLARERDLNLAEIPATEAGRITKEAVQDYLDRTQSGAQVAKPSEAPTPGPAPAPESKPAPPPARVMPHFEPTVAGERREERVRMTRRRQTIARRLVEAQHAAAMLTTFNEIDMSAVMDLRKRHKESFKQKYGVSLGISSFFVKAVIGALRAFPRLNAEIQGDEIVLYHYYDIGIAVGASGGLVVPVLRDADRLSFAAIETAIKDFARKAGDRTLSLDDLRGGTFTLTNGGVFGSLMSTPILNPPQAGILGLHKIQDRPVGVSGQIVLRPMMYVALSYDHRLVDGLEAVQFLVRVKELVEDPGSLLIES